MNIELPNLYKADRVLCWFSCGATSAIATKIALEVFTNVLPVEVVYCDTLLTEHSDNMRFISECENWLGADIKIIGSKKFSSTWDVFQKTRYLVGPAGARCTLELKKVVRQQYENAFRDIQVFGFDNSEKKRIDRFNKNNPEARLWAPLHQENISKKECISILNAAKIETPKMYRLGYKNNNCIGCVKGQMGYWNKIRIDFPEVFNRMALLERELNVAICKSYAGDNKRKRVFLDELDPTAGRYSQEPSIECGILCETPDEIS